MRPGSRLILDTNLFVLLVVGATDQSLIGKHKRTRGYSPLDLELLREFIEDFQFVITTPNILSETSNLLRQCDEKHAVLLLSTLGWFIGKTSEQYVPTIKVVGMDCMPRLGITDSTILQLLDDTTTLLTVDFMLYREALARGRAATNFNHLREEWL